MAVFRERFLAGDLFAWHNEGAVLFETAPRQNGDEVHAARGVLAAASRAARSALAHATGPVCIVERQAVREAFAGFDPQVTYRIEQLLGVFLPTTLLYTQEPALLENGFMYQRDGVAPVQWMQGLCYGHDAVLPEGQVVVMWGETILIPPAVRGEGARRSDWVRHTDLDAPRWREAGGPFWRLGRSRLWRLQVISWHERLLLAALLGTSRDSCVLVSPAVHFPRAGFVLQTAAAMGSRIACLALEDLPEAARDVLENGRQRWTARTADGGGEEA